MRPLLASCAALLALGGAPLCAQTSVYRVDFGDEDLQSGGSTPVWNDVHTEIRPPVIGLVDELGNASTITLSWIDPVGREEQTGVQVPAVGSQLEALGWPVSAISDSIFSDTLTPVPETQLEFGGLDTTATYDLVLLGSVMGGQVSLATEYTLIGADRITAVAEVTDNDATVQHIRGIRADDSGRIMLSIRNATSNTHLDRRYHINALSLIETPFGAQPPLVGFDLNVLELSRVIAHGPFAASIGLYTSDGSAPQVELDLTDLVTGQAPVWLSAPRTAIVGQPIPLAIDPSGLSPRTYTALMTAQAQDVLDGAALIVLTARDPGRLNILYYGNSYSGTNGSINQIIDRLTEELGLPVPLGVPRFVSGKNVGHHLMPTQVEAIYRSFPLGEEWDYVVIQGGTVEAAATAGSPSNFVANGLAVMDNVRAHSTDVKAVIYQTWARGAGHSFYTGSTPLYPGGPFQMQAELEAGNELLAAAIDANYGPGTSVVAAAGETLQLRGFDPAFYKQDLSHPAPVTTAQAALTVFSRIFGEPACPTSIDFATPGPLATHLAAWGVSEDDWLGLVGIADRAGDPSLREYPGSSEDLLLTSGEPGDLDPCGIASHPAGKLLRFELTSPAGTYGGVPALIYFDVLGTQGGNTFVPPWTEVYYTPSAWIQAVTTGLGPSGLATELSLAPGLVGQTLLVQGVSEDPSANTSNSMTLSDAHAVQILLPDGFTSSLEH